MFGRSSIALEWGQGFNGADAKPAQKSVRQSLNLATDVLSSMGITLNGRKRIKVVDRGIAALDVDGIAYSDWQISLYSSASRHPRNASRVMLYDALTIGHELFHAERMRNYALSGRLENVTTEGLAYCGEEQMATKEARLIGIDDRASRLRTISPRTVEQLGSAFLEETAENPRKRDIAWLDKRVEGGFTTAEVLGVSLVHKMLDNGAEFKDLLLLPAEEFIETS